MIRGTLSEKRLATVRQELQDVIRLAAKRVDILVIEGHRGETLQTQYYLRGASKLPWPKGEHNGFPSNAADIAPYPWNPKDTAAFVRLGSVMIESARELGVKLRWGGDWDGDGDRTDQKFNDLVHYEMKRA